MKKRILIFLLMLCPLIMGYTNGDQTDISVTVGTVETPVYNVEVTWDSMEFTYNETINYIWDNSNHSYELTESTYKWNTSSNKININNKSTMPVKIELKYISTNENINGIFDMSKTTIKSNESIASKLTLDGTLPSNNINYVKVGTINLVIS